MISSIEELHTIIRGCKAYTLSQDVSFPFMVAQCVVKRKSQMEIEFKSKFDLNEISNIQICYSTIPLESQNEDESFQALPYWKDQKYMKGWKYHFSDSNVMTNIDQNMMILDGLSIFNNNITSLEDILFEHIFLIYIKNYLKGLGYAKVKAEINAYFMLCFMLAKQDLIL